MMLSRFGLYLRLWLARFGAINVMICLLWLAGLSGYIWGLPALHSQNNIQRQQLTGLQAALQNKTNLPVVVQRSASEDRLKHFYDVLGEARYSEQQVKTLFAIAAKHGLTLNVAEYKLTTNNDGRYQAYQIVLPVKGQYQAIRQFCEQTLLAIPFASLDEINFKRDAIANQILEARLRLTIYLTASPVPSSRKEEAQKAPALMQGQNL